MGRHPVVKSGIVQFDVCLGEIDHNLAVAKRLITSLARKGVQLVLLPEMWSTGFVNDSLEELSETTPEILEELMRLAKKRQLTIIGSLPEKRVDGIYNTAYVVDRGVVCAEYRKVHLFTPTSEDKYFKSGRNAVVANTSLGRIGLMICYDLRFPELCRALALKGAEIIAVVAQWPAARVSHWDVLLKARAVENQVFVLGANRSGRDDELIYAGHSRLVSPYGEVLARAARRSATISATIDLSVLEQTRKQIPCLEQRVPEAYE
ncbi:MAG: hypothetical protein BBJ60_01330 [Desulfobacterales bacterium S7086C20]|nr:MAG: hypothetical protein BBJ60_01330 [Desulfobacterales bacterium S7086C20]